MRNLWNASRVFVAIVKWIIPICLLIWQLVMVVVAGPNPILNITISLVAIFYLTRGQISVFEDKVVFRRFGKKREFGNAEIVRAVDSAIPWVDVMEVRVSGGIQRLQFLNDQTHPVWRSSNAVQLLNQITNKVPASGSVKDTLQHSCEGRVSLKKGALSLAAGAGLWLLVRPLFSSLYDQLPARISFLLLFVSVALIVVWWLSSRTKRSIVLLFGAGISAAEAVMRLAR